MYMTKFMGLFSHKCPLLRILPASDTSGLK